MIYHHGKCDGNGIWDQLLLSIVFPMLQNTRNFFLDRTYTGPGLSAQAGPAWRLYTQAGIPCCDIPSWKGQWERHLGSTIIIHSFSDATKYKKFFFRIELLQGQAFPHRQGRLGAYTHKQELHVGKENYLSRRAVPDWAARKA